jgi:SAM-dependent methyltransferase
MLNNKIHTKHKAEWIPSMNRLILPLVSSIWSHITLPFHHKKNNSILEFFKANYSLKPDLNIFDGNVNNFYTQIKRIYYFKKNHNCTVIDLGCGKGSLLNWFIENGIKYDRYIGVDFAVKSKILSNNASIINTKIEDFNKYFQYIRHPITLYLTNTLCYLDDIQFINFLKSCKKNDELIIVDPYPNLLWKSHFNGIKPFYRRLDYVCKLLKECGWNVKYKSIDYVFVIFGVLFISKISYSIYCTLE